MQDLQTEEEKIKRDAQKVNNNGTTSELKNATQNVVTPNNNNNNTGSDVKNKQQ